MNRHTPSKSGTEESRESQRSEWGRTFDAEHPFEARERAPVSSKRQALHTALSREHKRQIRELGSR